jgi:hypothetical protein
VDPNAPASSGYDVPPYYDLIGSGADFGTAGDLDAIVGAQIATGGLILTGADGEPVHPAHAHHPHHWGGFESPREIMIQQLASRHAAMLAPRALTKSREYTIGFSGAPVAIPGGTPAVLKASPQVPFKGRRLIIPSDVAGALIILNLIVGKNPVLVSADPVAARAYTELGVGVDLNMDTAQIAQVISLQLSNVSGASVSVTPTMIGTAME